MGIQGLLPYLEKASKPCHISEFRGATVAIDTYCWLHKGAAACTFQLASGEDTQSLVNYCLKFIKLLQSFNIKPILVFDGKNLPAKAGTELKRRQSRNKARQRATELLKLGKTDEARSYLRQGINITPDMAVTVIKECQKLQIDCIVAPYESDAQLAFFSSRGIAEIIITEDSDLMLFGCSKVLYKLDMRGCGYLVDAENIPLSMNIRPHEYTFDKFRYMCILSGCDYIDSLQGIGLKKAEKFIKMTAETNPLIFLDNIPRYLNMRHLQVTEKYKEDFMLANATFRHQTVFDPYKRQLVPLSDPHAYGTLPKYCKNSGEIFDHEIAYQVALGNLHPTNHKTLNNWSPTKNGHTEQNKTHKFGASCKLKSPTEKLSRNSIWSAVMHKSESRKQQLCLSKKGELARRDSKMEIVKINTEELEIEADKKIETELASYFKKPVKRKIEYDDESQTEQRNERISPVLQKNPFLKKLSKFQLTKSDTQLVIKSRYFCTQSDTNKTEPKLEIKECEDEYVEASDSKNKPDNCLDPPLEALSNIKLSESCTDDEQINNDDIRSKLSIEIVSRNISSQPCSSRDSVDNGSTKRKRLGPSKTLGIKRSKSDTQATLHNFFTKLSK